MATATFSVLGQSRLQGNPSFTKRKKGKKRGGGGEDGRAENRECLPSSVEPGFDSQHVTLETDTCNPSPQEAEAGILPQM